MSGKTYNRTPLLRSPSKSDWSGRKRGVVVHEGLDYFITCTLVGTRVSNTVLTVSSTLRTSFAECIAERWTTQRPIRYGDLSPTDTFSNNNAVSFLDQSTQHVDIGPSKPTFRKHRSNIGSHIYVACLIATFILFPIYPFATD